MLALRFVDVVCSCDVFLEDDSDDMADDDVTFDDVTFDDVTFDEMTLEEETAESSLIGDGIS